MRVAINPLDQALQGGFDEFLGRPVQGLVPNLKMTPEEAQVSVVFADERILLGVLCFAKEPLQNNCPLFLVLKVIGADGQPTSYRCIADMKKGRQNEVCVGDLTHMAAVKDILPHTFPGGEASQRS